MESSCGLFMLKTAKALVQVASEAFHTWYKTQDWSFKKKKYEKTHFLYSMVKSLKFVEENSITSFVEIEFAQVVASSSDSAMNLFCDSLNASADMANGYFSCDIGLNSFSAYGFWYQPFTSSSLKEKSPAVTNLVNLTFVVTSQYWLLRPR